jgi:hypothetical protein
MDSKRILLKPSADGRGLQITTVPLGSPRDRTTAWLQEGRQSNANTGSTVAYYV